MDHCPGMSTVINHSPDKIAEYNTVRDDIFNSNTKETSSKLPQNKTNYLIEWLKMFQKKIMFYTGLEPVTFGS